MLHGVIRNHLADSLRAAADRADGAGSPEWFSVLGAVLVLQWIMAAVGGVAIAGLATEA